MLHSYTMVSAADYQLVHAAAACHCCVVQHHTGILRQYIIMMQTGDKHCQCAGSHAEFVIVDIAVPDAVPLLCLYCPAACDAPGGWELTAKGLCVDE